MFSAPCFLSLTHYPNDIEKCSLVSGIKPKTVNISVDITWQQQIMKEALKLPEIASPWLPLKHTKHGNLWRFVIILRTHPLNSEKKSAPVWEILKRKNCLQQEGIVTVFIVFASLLPPSLSPPPPPLCVFLKIGSPADGLAQIYFVVENDLDLLISVSHDPSVSTSCVLGF